MALDPTMIASMMGGASNVLKALQPTAAPAPNQRADGYAMGATLDSALQAGASGGATGGAYGGAWSQANVDGSNWTVSTKGGKATGGGTSGGNGGVSPVQTGMTGSVQPSPFQFSAGLPTANMGDTTMLMMAAIAVLAVLVLKR